MKKRILGTFLALLMIFPFVAVLADEPAKGTERSNVDIIYDFLTGDMKLNSAAACGILANIEMESGFNPEALGDNGTSYGICQWHDIAEGSGRWTKLREFCVKNGYDPSKLMSQLYYLKYELQNFYPKVWNYVYAVENSDQGAYDAGYYWCYNFEIPDKREERSVARGNSAKEKYWPKYNATEPESAFEIWRVASEISLNVRTGPDTSYPVADKLADGTEITVTQAVSTASYVWGRIPGGWCVLDYCEYVSGAIYTVEYVTGCASRLTPQPKHINEELVLVCDGVERYGYTFGGWAVEQGTEAVYTAPDNAVYRENASAVLYAVWTRDDSVQRITGDVYFDGKVDMRDLVYYIRYTIGAELGDFETECGDLTGDGNINMMDIVYMIRAFAEWEGYTVGQPIGNPGGTDPSTDTKPSTDTEPSTDTGAESETGTDTDGESPAEQG